jgi:hypothetical protein
VPAARLDEGVESPSVTETLEFEAVVAKAVVAALVEAMPRITVAALTGHTS